MDRATVIVSSKRRMGNGKGSRHETKVMADDPFRIESGILGNRIANSNSSLVEAAEMVPN